MNPKPVIIRPYYQDKSIILEIIRLHESITKYDINMILLSSIKRILRDLLVEPTTTYF